MRLAFNHNKPECFIEELNKAVTHNLPFVLYQGDDCLFVFPQQRHVICFVGSTITDDQIHETDELFQYTISASLYGYENIAVSPQQISFEEGVQLLEEFKRKRFLN